MPMQHSALSKAIKARFKIENIYCVTLRLNLRHLQTNAYYIQNFNRYNISKYCEKSSRNHASHLIGITSRRRVYMYVYLIPL